MTPKDVSQGTNGQPGRGKRATQGSLYVVSLPIGDPQDVTLRALQVLRQVDVIATKDPAKTRRLLHRYRIQGTLTTYDRRTAYDKAAVLVHRISQGLNAALVSDAGTPLVYDPGLQLVALANRRGIPVIAVPGVSAATAALMIAGLPSNSFLFQGQVPNSPPALKRLLRGLAKEPRTMIFFPQATSLARFLKQMYGVWGNRSVCLAIDLTRMTEKISRGRLRNILASLSHGWPCPASASVTVVVEGARKTKQRVYRTRC